MSILRRVCAVLTSFCGLLSDVFFSLGSSMAMRRCLFAQWMLLRRAWVGVAFVIVALLSVACAPMRPHVRDDGPDELVGHDRDGEVVAYESYRLLSDLYIIENLE